MDAHGDLVRRHVAAGDLHPPVLSLLQLGQSEAHLAPFFVEGHALRHLLEPRRRLLGKVLGPGGGRGPPGHRAAAEQCGAHHSRHQSGPLLFL